jgi:hypothetical protein
MAFGRDLILRGSEERSGGVQEETLSACTGGRPSDVRRRWQMHKYLARR